MELPSEPRLASVYKISIPECKITCAQCGEMIFLPGMVGVCGPASGTPSVGMRSVRL